MFSTAVDAPHVNTGSKQIQEGKVNTAQPSRLLPYDLTRNAGKGSPLILLDKNINIL